MCTEPTHREHSIAEVAHLRHLEAKVREGVDEPLKPVPNASRPRKDVVSPSNDAWTPGCHSASGSSCSSSASKSRWLNASRARLKASTFSCDIARAVSRDKASPARMRESIDPY